MQSNTIRMEKETYFSGGLDSWPSKSEMADIIRSAGFNVYVGEYSIRLEDCEHFVFQHYGGDICDPSIDAFGFDRNSFILHAQRVSDAFANQDIRHRFELYDESDEMILYLHHRWPRELAN